MRLCSRWKSSASIVLFEALDLLADGGLGAVQEASGASDAACLGNRHMKALRIEVSMSLCMRPDRKLGAWFVATICSKDILCWR